MIVTSTTLKVHQSWEDLLSDHWIMYGSMSVESAYNSKGLCQRGMMSKERRRSFENPLLPNARSPPFFLASSSIRLYAACSASSFHRNHGFSALIPTMASYSSFAYSDRLILLISLLLVVFTPASSLFFNFSTFDSSTPNFIEFQNDTFFDKVIKLTRNQIGDISQSVGRAFYRNEFRLWDAGTGEVADFTTHFSFVIDSFQNTRYGDGLAFFLSPFPSVVPPNSYGGSLGLVESRNNLNASANQIVAVEFDTFKNDWDPSADHVGINVNSLASAATVMWNSSIKDGRTANAWVSYHAGSKNLSVFLTYEDNPIFTGNSTLSLVVDLRKILPEKVAIGFSAATGSLTEIHNIVSWEFSSTELPSQRTSRIGLSVGLSAAVGFLFVSAGLIWFLLWRKRSSAPKSSEGDIEMDYDDAIDDEFEKGRGPKRFPLTELVAATRNFADDLKLGQGGFGSVYRGFLREMKMEVAIKRVARGSQQGKKEYISEVTIISRLRHRNLVQLVGWCHERKELLLVYEFMPNGSLDSYLYGRDGKRSLAWPVRYKIAVGLASALLYLHEEWEECVVHRDVKPSNVMLDGGFNAKLGDFGLARLVDHEGGPQTTMLAGTMGYLAPECVTTGKASKESDVFSFGIVALELACGRRPVERKQSPEKVALVPWVWELYGGGRLMDAVDERLRSEGFEEEEVARLMIVGLWCAHPDSGLRPTIRQAIAVLMLEASIPQLPAKMPVPLYYAPPLKMCNFTYTTSEGASTTTSALESGLSGYDTTGSDLSRSSPGTRLPSSASLLKSYNFETYTSDKRSELV
ncbi:L-type lectin-domain containing receptor kinase IX.1 [Apostasia shenzhenica]|uniref:non-specific serine/threonine protein kinase n=1 Tax=Apostasia shenzhenica TaxID=1088818 RepID=A0A2H9ZQP3_9ASPA|nr:L-type lectin-domain containing receptor kinase IX.1 [Apostasia shenzhenica]